jgi:hypothetical protein
MIVIEVPNLVTLPVTKSSQYFHTWSGGSLLLVKCKYTSLNLRSPPLNQLLSHFNNIRPLLLIYGRFGILLSVSKPSGCSIPTGFPTKMLCTCFPTIHAKCLPSLHNCS